MEYKKSELTKFAKTCVYANNVLLNSICVSGDVVYTDMGKKMLNGLEDENSELIYEVAKRFAKYTKDETLADANTSERELSDLTNVLSLIIECCEENDWFRNDMK